MISPRYLLGKNTASPEIGLYFPALGDKLMLISPRGTMQQQRHETEIKSLQQKCWMALNLYTDLAEACCEIMIQAKSAPLKPDEYSRLMDLRREESQALMDYLQARMRLTTSLSIPTNPVDRGVWLVLNASDDGMNTKQHSSA
jgi:hypothetical protein